MEVSKSKLRYRSLKKYKTQSLSRQIELMGTIMGSGPLLIAGIALSLLASQTIALNLILVVGWVLLTILGGVIGWLWARRLKKRLKTSLDILVQGAAELEEGSYDYLFPSLYSESDFATVYARFNQVTRSFQNSAGQLIQRLDEVRQLYCRVAEQTNQLESFNQIAQAISSSLDVAAIYQMAEERLHQQFSFDWLTIAVLSPDDDELRVVKAEPAGLVTAYQESKVVRVESLPYKAFNQGTTIYQPYIWRGEELNPEADKAIADGGLRSVVLLPIYYNQQKLGVLGLASYQPNAFSNSQIALFEAMAVQLSIAINNARMYDALRQAYDKLEAAQTAMKQAARQSALGEMAAGVAHDFNNILTSILCNGELLAMVLSQAEERELAQGITKAATDAAQMIKRIADFGRRRTYVEYSRLDLNTIVKDALDFTQPRLKAQEELHGALIEVEVKLNATHTVCGNAHELREVMTNFIVNAIDAMPEGGKLELTTFSDEQQVGISIRDTGLGMSEEVLAHIFEPFYSTKGERGSGLGLAVTTGIVSRHHGQLNVKSKPQLGTTFTVTLPVATVCTEMLGDALVESQVLIAEPMPELVSQSLRVLVADDDAGSRMALGRSLRKAGYVVEEAQNGVEAWDILKSEDKGFDLLITDMGMPLMNGLDLVQEMRQANMQTPVIMVTGWGYAPNRGRLRSLQIETVIAKPYHYQELINMIDRTLRPGSLTPDEPFSFIAG